MKRIFHQSRVLLDLHLWINPNVLAVAAVFPKLEYCRKKLVIKVFISWSWFFFSFLFCFFLEITLMKWLNTTVEAFPLVKAFAIWTALNSFWCVCVWCWHREPAFAWHLWVCFCWTLMHSLGDEERFCACECHVEI